MTSRILVADDDEDIARFVEPNRVLEGFDVDVVGDGVAALEGSPRRPTWCCSTE